MDYLAAHKDLTIFWAFLDDDVYLNKSNFADKVKIAALGLNVFHFFIRKNCFFGCVENLLKTFDDQVKLGLKTFSDKRMVCEILVIGYLCGIVFMPGANQ